MSDLPGDWTGETVNKSLVDDLADVLSHMVVGWEDLIGFDLAEHPEVQRVMARYGEHKAGSRPPEQHDRGWWGMACFNGLSTEQQERVVRWGNLPMGYAPEGGCTNGAEVEITLETDEYPGPRYYCRDCAVHYLSNGEFGPQYARGHVSVDMGSLQFAVDDDLNKLQDCTFGVQVHSDGRVWVCVNAVTWLRFKPNGKSIDG